LGRALGSVIDDAGCVVALEGPLGAGKTLFVKGVAAGLGLDPDAVGSPTFVIASEYARPDGPVLVHLDLYRLESEASLEAAGFLDALVPGRVVAIEWADRFPDALPTDRLVIRLARDAAVGATARRVSASAHGPASEALLARWRRSLAAQENSRWH